LAACLLSAFLTIPIAHAQIKSTDKPAPNPQETKKNDAPQKQSKAEIKYDVNRIGQRGIGKGLNFYSLKREHELGESLAATFDHSTKIIHDPVINDYISRLVQKIVVHSDAEIPFTIKVIDSGNIPRAYGLPGGFLYVDDALIASAEDEAELVAVMAHEIAHVAARHATRALTRKELTSFVNYATMFAGPTSVLLENATGIAGPLSMKKFSRDSEYEADLLGMEYAYSAGYDPQAMLDALEKMHAIEVERNAAKAAIPGYHLATKIPLHTKLAKSFSSYPLTEERLQRLQSEITEFLPARADYVLDTQEFQGVRAHVLAGLAPTLRHHDPNDDKGAGPVLRRTTEDSSPAAAPDGGLKMSLKSMSASLRSFH
jgi:beta-barrel assembly-enhancing protease